MIPRLISTLAALILISAPGSAKAADWVNMEKSDGIAYFFVATPAKIERYDMQSRSWLSPIQLSAALGPLSCGTVDAEGIYVAYDKAVLRYNLAGGNETHLLNAAGTVEGLFTDGNLLLVNHSISLYAKMTSVSKTTNTVIATFENYIDATYGASISRSNNRLFGTSRGVSPADVTYVQYADNGTFVSGGDSPHHGDYSIGSKTWVFPNESRFVDTTGNVYSTGNLSYSLSFGTKVDDIAFSGGDIPIVLSGGKIIAYTNSLLPAGSYTLSSAAKNILVDGDAVIAFRTDGGTAITTEVIPLGSLNAPQPGQPVNPRGLAYVPDEVFRDNTGIIHLYSKAHQTIFRWNTATQTYLDGLPLLGSADFVAYSPVTHTLYTSYATGLIRRMDLSAAVPAEIPFAQLPSAALGLATAGRYLFACDGSGAWATHYTYAPDGTKVSSKDWNYYSRSYVWNEANQKMYFFRDDTSPNDLLWEEINANGAAYPTLQPGAIGTTKDSPLHSSAGFSHPIRPSANGSVIALGGGVLHSGTTLERLPNSAGNSFTDAAWGQSALYSIRGISSVAQLQQWTPPSYGQTAILQLPGTPRRILPLGNENFLALVTSPSGLLTFNIVDAQFNIVAPEVIAAPQGLGAVVSGSTQISLSWEDTSGETGYRVERMTGSGGSWQTAGTTLMGVTSFSDVGVVAGNTYSYRVLAFNGTKISEATAVLAVPFSAPEAPVPAATALSSSSIRLDWPVVPLASSYKLYRKTESSSSWTLLASSVTTNTFTNTSLTAGTTCQYKLQAVNAVGTSPDSEIVFATTFQTPPDIPYLSTPYAQSSTTVWLSWSGLRADTFTVEKMTGNAGTWDVIATLPSTATSHMETRLQPGGIYAFRVRATNAAGTSGYSIVRSIVMPQLPLPTAPANLTAEPFSSTRIDLAWQDSSDETGYRVERQTGEAAWITLADLPADTIRHEDGTAQEGNYYNYRIVASNTRGEAVSTEVRIQAAAVGNLLSETFDPAVTYPFWSELSGASVRTGPQGFLSGNALWMGGNGQRQVTLAGLDLASGGTLRFEFRAGNSATDGAGVWDNSEANEGVVLEYSVNSGTWEMLSLLDNVFPANSRWTSYEIPLPLSARSANTRFRWRQLMHSGSALDTWALDNIRVDGVLPGRPDAVPFIMGSANSSRSVALSWVAGERASSYVIERRTPSGAWDVVGTAGVGQTYFTDETAKPATIYSYRVISRNASGDSAPSSYILVTTWSTLAEWRFQNYGTLSDSGQAGSANDNGTGISNLARFAFNMASTDGFYQVRQQGDTKGLPTVQMHSSSGLLRVAFIRRRAENNPGVSYTVEFSDNAGEWTATGKEVISAAIDETFEYVVWEDEEAVPRKAIRFARVRVTN